MSKLFGMFGTKEEIKKGAFDIDFKPLIPIAPQPKEYRNLSDLVYSAESWNRKGDAQLELLSLEMLRDYLTTLIDKKQPVNPNTTDND